VLKPIQSSLLTHECVVYVSSVFYGVCGLLCWYDLFSHHLRWKPKRTEANIKNKLTTLLCNNPMRLQEQRVIVSLCCSTFMTVR
jgi:hypothetical protein